MEGERLRTQRMHLSTKQWLAAAGPMEELLGGMAVVHAHYKHTFKQTLSTKAAKDKASKMLEVIEDPKVHIIFPAFVDLLKKLNVLNKKFDKDFLNVNKVASDIAVFEAWLDDFALRRGKKATGDAEAIPDSTIQRVVKQWLNKSLPPGDKEDTTAFEKSLRRMRRLKVVEEGGKRHEQLEYSAPKKSGGDGDTYVFTMVLTKRVLEEAVSEIRRAAQVLKDQIKLRFPKLEVMSAFEVFDVDFKRAERDTDFVDEKLAVLGKYLGVDDALLRDEYSELWAAVSEAKDSKKITGNLAVYDHVLTAFRNDNKKMRILSAASVWLVIQAQNGQLERDFSAKRRLEDRLKGGFTPKVLDQRLRIRVNGPDPDDLWSLTADGLRYEDLIVRIARATMGKHYGSAGRDKRQRSLEEILAEGMPAQKKPRADKGGSHKPPVPRPDHAREALMSEDKAKDVGHAVFDSFVAGGGKEQDSKTTVEDAESMELDDI